MPTPIRGGGSGKQRHFAPRINRPKPKPTHTPPSAPNRGPLKPDPTLKPSGGNKGWKHIESNPGPKGNPANSSGDLKHSKPSSPGPKIPGNDTDIPPSSPNPNLHHGTPPYRGPLWIAQQPSASGQATAAGIADNYAGA